MTEAEREEVRDLLGMAARAVSGRYPDPETVFVGMDGMGSRPSTGTQTLLGVTLPATEHYHLIAARGAVTLPSGKRCLLTVAVEEPHEGWTDETMRQVLGLPG